MTNYESVCSELDALTLTYLTTISEYKQQWETASELFQKGYLDLSHAKYTMGSRTISHYSYDERMKANTKIEMGDDKVLHVKKVSEKNKEEPEEEQKEEEKEDNNNNSNNNNNLRKRNVNKKKEEEEEEGEWISSSPSKGEEEEKPNDIELDKKEKKKKKQKSDNPLHWFGLFVSPSLRTSQEHFITVLPLLIEQVNKIKELEEIEKKYNALLETKLALKLKNTSLQDVTV